MSNQQPKINEKPVNVGFFVDDGFITIQTDKGQLLGLTQSDAKKLIKILQEKIDSFKCFEQKVV